MSLAAHAKLKQIADLSALRVTEAEMESWAADVDRILAFFDRLKSLDVNDLGTSPDDPHAVASWRDDLAEDTLNPAAFLAQAPSTRSDQLVVPAVVRLEDQ